jgi:hypothetical protein
VQLLRIARDALAFAQARDALLWRHVEPKPGIAKLGTMKGINKSPEELSEKLPELIEKWRDTFGV